MYKRIKKKKIIIKLKRMFKTLLNKVFIKIMTKLAIKIQIF